MKIGLYGGTFDPIHHGHLLLAREALEQLKLDKIIFLPARISPFKLSSAPAPAELRTRLLEAALQEEPALEWDACELERADDGPSYTIDTIRLMQERYPNAQLYYLLGNDQLEGLPQWKNYEQLVESAQFVVLNRGNQYPVTSYPVINRRLDISATEIRDRIAQRRSIRYLVPENVRDILLHSNAYGREIS
jgi:nicotinate-nucleotide adenylyltransferase